MRRDITGQPTGIERPLFLVFFGSLGFAGCLALLAGAMIAPFFVPEYDWVSDTISDLAAGEHRRIMDFALYGFAAGLLATALATSHAHLGGVFWSAGVFSLAVLAVLVTIIAARDEYGDGDHDGVVIHTELVYGLGVFFLATALCMARGIGDHHPWAMRTLFALGCLWALMAPAFFLMPTSVDGLFERLLGLVAVGMLCTLCTVMVTRGWRAFGSD